MIEHRKTERAVEGPTAAPDAMGGGGDGGDGGDGKPDLASERFESGDAFREQGRSEALEQSERDLFKEGPEPTDRGPSAEQAARADQKDS